MTTIPLRLGPLVPDGCIVWRSGLHWQCDDGQLCKAGQVVAYCNIVISSVQRPTKVLEAFDTEVLDFQAAFVTQTAGRIRISAASSRGGYLDHNPQHKWDPDFAIAELECEDPQSPAEPKPLRLMLATGRRVSDHAEIRAGLLTGWHDRSRAWWGDGDRIAGTLLGSGTCDLSTTIRGEHFNFLEFLNALPGSAQVVLVPDTGTVPCARVMLEQVQRTPEASAEIAADLAATFPLNSPSSVPADWVFAGILLASLQGSPLTEDTHVLTRGGVQRISRPDAIVLSLISEPQRIFRHRRLGYSLCLHHWRLPRMSEASRGWLRAEFEPVLCDSHDIYHDYCKLIDCVQSRSKTQFLVMNLVSSSGYEDFLSYAQFEKPMGRVVQSVRSKEMNLMLHDLARERDVAIVDVDAIVAEIGAGRHAPDGVHYSGTLHAEVRREILRILDSRGVPGFHVSQLR